MPLNEFAISTDAVVLADSSGTVRLLNSPASTLLRCNPDEVIGESCWKVMGLRSRDGKALCSPHCRVQKSFRTNPCVKQAVLSISGDGTPQPLDLLSFKIPPASNGRFGVLHVIVPDFAIRDVVFSPPGIQRCPVDLNTLNTLTPRETQVLEALSTGTSTASIASSLCISIVTVRNHIRTILRKLDVHSRLDAVLLWISNPHVKPPDGASDLNRK